MLLRLAALVTFALLAAVLLLHLAELTVLQAVGVLAAGLALWLASTIAPRP